MISKGTQSLEDRTARFKIRQKLRQNYLVEASAGSGKTYSLIQRMVALIQSGQYRVDQIAAITFTRKAAIELKERFQQEIEISFRTAHQKQERIDLYLALEQMEQCYIGTIHSFCSRILRERPIEAGLDPEFTEIDEVENDLLMDQAWDRYLIQLKEGHSLTLSDLEKLGIDFNDLKSCYQQL